jgi:hypothetical protein
MKKILHPVELKNVSYEGNIFKFQKRLGKIYFLLIALFIVVATATNTNAQTVPLPKDHPIKIAAPNLPLFERASAGSGRVLYGEKYDYAYSSVEKVKEWMVNFPSELETYKVAIKKFLADADLDTMTNERKELYYDLKNQWILITQTNN